MPLNAMCKPGVSSTSDICAVLILHLYEGAMSLWGSTRGRCNFETLSVLASAYPSWSMIAIAGVDDVDSYEELCRFISTVSERSGVKHFVVHARKCILAGLSPAQNRTIPPLRCGPSSAMLVWPCIHYLDCPSDGTSSLGKWRGIVSPMWLVVSPALQGRRQMDTLTGMHTINLSFSSHQPCAMLCRREWVWALGRDFPELEFSLNGVVQDCHEAAAALQHSQEGAHVHGVMIGRAAYHGPWACLGNADRAVFGAAANAAANRREVRPCFPSRSQAMQESLSSAKILFNKQCRGPVSFPVGAKLRSSCRAVTYRQCPASSLTNWPQWEVSSRCSRDAKHKSCQRGIALVPCRRALLLQVLARYGDYGDAILGRFGVKEDGNKIPNVRAVIKPLIGLFYGEAGGRRWRNAIDQALLRKPATVSEVIHVRALLV